MPISPRQEIQILHVDDDSSITDLTGTFLEREDDRFTVETATSADEGLQRLSDYSPDCIISDYNMPGMDGIEFLQTVRKEHPDLPFILFTGKGSETVASDAISADVTDYLQKQSGSEQYELLANRIQNVVTARRNAEEAARQQDLMERTEVLGSTGGWELQVESEFLRLTDGLKRVYGVEPDRDISLDEVMDFYEPDSQRRIEEVIDAAIENGYAEADELSLRTTDGERRIVEGNAELVENDGDGTLLRGVVHDITDRRERQQELSRLQRAIDDANVPITLADPSKPDQPLVYVNDAFEEMTGYPPEETLGRNCRFLQGKETDPDKVATLREAIDDEESVTVELRNYRKDGSEFWNRLTVTPIYDEDGNLVRYLGTQENVTERKEREHELRAERRFIEQALNTLDDLFYVLDTDGNFRQWNDRFTQTTGYADSELTEMQVLGLFPEDNRERIADAIQMAVSGETVTVEADLLTADGERRPYEFTAARLTDADRNVTGVVGIGRDLTERRQRERRFQALVEESNDIISIVDADGVFQYQSPSIERILGYDPEETIGDTAWDYVHPDDRADLIKVFERGVADPDMSPVVEYRARHADGSWRWLEARGNNQLDNPAVEGYIVNSREITEQEQRKRELERYERLVENLPVGVFRTTMDGEIIDANKAAVDIYDADSISQLRDVEVKKLYADNSDRGDLLGQLQEAGRVENKLVEFKTLNGDHRFVRTTLTLNKDGERKYLEGILQDVTDQYELEREFAQIKTIAESLNDAVYVLDEHGQFTYVNNEFLELTGYSEEMILGSTPELIKDEEAMKTAERQLGRLLSDDGPDNVTFETVIQPDDSKPVVCEDHMGVLPYEGDSFNGSVGVLRDISGRKRRERELRRERDRLDEFASVVSHDLRNPLNVAQGNLELLDSECDSDKIEPIRRAHARMNDLIDDLLTLARQGDTVSDTESIVLEEIAETAWGTVESHRASLHVETNQTIRCDPSRLQQLLENLYRNAVEHGGPQVAVTVGKKDDGFYVEDTGPGIPEDEREQVFEPGYSTAADGTGFGLRIVKRVAETHGWKVSVTEGEQGGARFEFTGMESTDG